MRTIKTTSGTAVELDGDALNVIETISRDLARRKELEYGFEDVDREIQHIVDQMSEDDLRSYLKESLFMSFNRFEVTGSPVHWLCPIKYCRLRTFLPNPSAICSTFLRVALLSKPCT